MKNFAITVIMGFLAGCTVYQYPTVDSPLTKTDRNEFTFKNDSLQITYRFIGSGGQIQMEVLNQGSGPITIDWKRSGLILNDRVTPYWKDVAQIDASGYYSISGTAAKPSEQAFIPPGAYITSTFSQVMSGFFQPIPGMEYSKVKLGFACANQLTFAERNSPISFRSYITYSGADLSRSKTIDHKFWISEVNESTSGPSYHFNNQNPFYNSEVSGFGHLMGGIVVGGLIWLLVIASQQAN